MADRTVYGHTHSENGWRMVDQGSCVWVKVPGTNVTLQIREGQPAKIMGAFAADYNAYVEPLRDADSACWTATNSVGTSNHLSGTGMDLNWNGPDGRTFRLGISKERAFPGDKARALDELYAFYEDLMFCGGRWSIRDWMHHQLNGNTYGAQNVDKVNDFIRRKIRADGFSTYKRSGTPAPPPPPPPPPPSKQDQYALAVIAEGRRRGITPRGIQIAFSVVYVESNWKMYANSKVPESLKLPHDAVGQDHDSVGLFQQRCPMWGPAEVLMDPTKSAGLFYDRLAKMEYNNPNRQPGDFAADVQRPAAQYRGRYQERMGDAVALYNRLAGATPPPPQGEDELDADAKRKLDAIYLELTQRHPSRSAVREPNEKLVDTWAGMDLNTDGNVDFLATDRRAQLGYPPAIERLKRVAQGGEPGRSPDDALLAQAILADVTKPAASVASRSVDSGTELASAGAAALAEQLDGRIAEVDRLREENAHLREENARLQAAVAPTVEVATTGLVSEKTSGDIAGQVVDSVKEWTARLLTMNAEERGALATSLKALQPPTGSQS